MQVSHRTAGEPKDPLLQPFVIKNLVLRNRVMSTSHASGLDVGGLPMEAYQQYHEEKAIGGIALTMFGGSSNVSIDSPNVFRQLDVSSDAVVPHLQRMSERVHARGAALMCQITHLGRRGEAHAGNWLPTIAPSLLRETLHRSFPKEMDRHDISRVISGYGAAARRCQQGGLDGIEVVAGAHLIGQFLSRRTNLRTDAFGGSIENRCRFGLMVFEEMRRQVGDSFVLGLRYVVDEGGGENSIDFDEAVRIAHIFERSGQVDFFNALYGKFDTELALTREWMPGMESPIAPWLTTVGAFKREVKTPVFHAARISDIATARHAIREGLLDMVAMTRAHIADPQIVRKIESGMEESIRPCVGATHCQSNFRPHCLHNPASGRETQLPQLIARSKSPGRKVVIVGAGPAGLEAARICGERGHQTVLFEAAERVGGQVLLAARGSWRRDILGIIDWRAQELRRLGVSVRTSVFAGPDEILSEAPSAVIVATGGVPNLDWLEGSEHVISAWDVISGQMPVSTDVLVYDGSGRHPALQALEVVTGNCRKALLVSIDAQVANELTYAERVTWKKLVHTSGVERLFEHELQRVERQGNRLIATFRNIVTLGEIKRTADQVIVEHGTAPAADIYFELRSESCNDGVTDLSAAVEGRQQPWPVNKKQFELHRIGDAVASRNIHAAMLDALRLCANL